jgi:predicted O-linked N-acetylglucosamine transferase (SPINDLY family)
MNPQITYLLNISIQQIQSNRLDDAERTLNQILRLQPKNAIALCFLGVIFAHRRNFDQALEYISRSIKQDPTDGNAFNNQGNILKELRRFEEAKLAYEKAIVLDKKNPEAINNLGNLYQDLGHYLDAIVNYDKAITLAPAYAEAYSNKGNALEKIGRYDESLKMFEKAIALNPNYIDAWLNRSFTLNKLKRFEDSLASCDQALKIDQKYARAWMVKGSMLSENGLYQPSIEFYDKALSIDPNFAESWACKGSSLNELKQYDQALLCYEKAYAGDANLEFLLGDIINLKQVTALWIDLEEQLRVMYEGIRNNQKVIQPFKFLSVDDSPLIASKVAKIWIANKFPLRNFLPPLKKYAHKKIRVGYFSADFKNHPVSYLMAELFELHNREHFEIYAFSVKEAEEGDEMRARLVPLFDKFLNVEGKTGKEVAELARECEIDIAVDLGGHTQFASTGIMSYRAAPIQVNYLGYPGTMGADYIDYIIADPVLIPPEFQQHYSEKVVYLPDTYMVDDSRRIPSKNSFTRKDCGLPEGGFIFCCFNNSYKFNKKILECWVRILNAVPESVLWISENNEVFRANIGAEFSKAGINSNRVIFAKRLDSMGDHLARFSLADLFLDTHPYNAHTTAVDSLKAGVPVLTLLGNAFAGRVAGSLLTAIGLPELITNSLEEYERVAIELGANQEKLNSLKAKLVENTKKEALFNTPLFVKNLESAYIQMYQRSWNGLSPEHIFVNPA